MQLRGKRILIISPQLWGEIRVSKHHYAIKLAERGNMVYFLNPPVSGRPAGKRRVELIESGEQNGLFIVTNYLDFPYLIKFHLPFLFYFIMSFHIKSIMKAIGGPLDIVWSFDLSNVYPLRYFQSSGFRIFHAVDMPHYSSGIEAARDADLIFSTAPEILARYKGYSKPCHFIDHGLADVFVKIRTFDNEDDKQRIGYSGNLLRADLDRSCLLRIIGKNPSVIFEFWGPFSPGQANIGEDDDPGTLSFVRDLMSLPNVRLHGPVPHSDLPGEFARMDGFLICYDLQAKDPVGPNYHKLMEYFSSGKVVVSSYVSVYEDKPELLEMVKDKSNDKLPGLFNKVISSLSFYNSIEMQSKRRAFALSNTYDRQLDKIEKILSEFPQKRIINAGK